MRFCGQPLVRRVIGEIGLRIDAIHFAGLDQRRHAGPVFGSFVQTGEESVLPSQRERMARSTVLLSTSPCDHRGKRSVLSNDRAYNGQRSTVGHERYGPDRPISRRGRYYPFWRGFWHGLIPFGAVLRIPGAGLSFRILGIVEPGPWPTPS
jgi:hypothetical protein